MRSGTATGPSERAHSASLLPWSSVPSYAPECGEKLSRKGGLCSRFLITDNVQTTFDLVCYGPRAVYDQPAELDRHRETERESEETSTGVKSETLV